MVWGLFQVPVVDVRQFVVVLVLLRLVGLVRRDGNFLSLLLHIMILECVLLLVGVGGLCLIFVFRTRVVLISVRIGLVLYLLVPMI